MNILCLGTPTWDGDYIKSTVKLMEQLAVQHKVLYVEYAFTYSDFAKGILKQKKNVPTKRLWDKSARLRCIQLESGASLHVLTLPPLLPINFLQHKKTHARAASYNAAIAKKHIQATLYQLGMQQLDWNINAFAPMLGYFLAGAFGEKKTAYYCYDEIAAAPYLKKHGLRYEKLLIRKVDALICSSRPLLQQKKQPNTATLLLQNAVDGKHFFQPFSMEKTNPQPIIGYLGSVDDRLDFDLLEKAVQRFAHCQFEFVGRINSEAAKRLKSYKNVIFLGAKPPKDLPKLVARFDVCLIPFLKNELTAGIYPMKINEYFALGKPVVATRFGDMQDFEDLALVADSRRAFLDGIATALLQESKAEEAKRRVFAERNTWAGRGEVLRAFLDAGVSIVSLHPHN